MSLPQERSSDVSKTEAIQAIISYSSFSNLADDNEEKEEANNSAEMSKRRVIQSIMRDTSLTPKVKQRKIQEFMAAGAKTEDKAKVDVSVPSAPPEDDNDSDDEESLNTQQAVSDAVKPTSKPLSGTASSPVEPLGNGISPPELSASSETPADAEGPSKQELVQEVMKDESLTPQEKQAKVREILATGAPFLNSPLIASRKASRHSSKTQQEFVREVLNDSSLTLGERQQKVRDILGKPSPVQKSTRRSLQLESSPKVTTPKAARRSLQIPSSPLVGASPGRTYVDPAARKIARETSRHVASSSPMQVALAPAVEEQEDDNNGKEKPKTQQELVREVLRDSSLTLAERQQKVRDIMGASKPTPLQRNSRRSLHLESSPKATTPKAARRSLQIPSSPLVGASPGRAYVDPAARKIARETSRRVASSSPMQSPGMRKPGVKSVPSSPSYVDPAARKLQRESNRSLASPRQSPGRLASLRSRMSPSASRRGPMESPGGSQRSQLRMLAAPPIFEEADDNDNDEESRPGATAASVGATAVSASSSNYVDPADRKRQRDILATSSGSNSGVAQRNEKEHRDNNDSDEDEDIIGAVSVKPDGHVGRSSSFIDPAEWKIQSDQSARSGGRQAPQASDGMSQYMIQAIMNDDNLTERQKQEQIRDILGGDGSGSFGLNDGGSARTSYQPPMNTMMSQSSLRSSSVACGVISEEPSVQESASEDPTNLEAGRSGEIEEDDEDKDGVVGDGVSLPEPPARLSAYVAGLDPNAVAPSVVFTEEEIAEEENIRKARFLWGGICCFCILIIAIVVPLVALAPDDKEEAIAVMETFPTDPPTLVPTRAPSIPPTPGAVVELLLELEVLYPSYEEYQAAFNSSDTPQYKALFWATGEGNPRGLSGFDPRLISRYALATFYFATNGDDWVRCSRDGANCDPGGEWLLAEDECGWLAVTCEEGTTDVTQIFFPPTGQAGENNVAGTLPFELGLLTNLKRITISRNNIGGSIPSSWIDLTTLEAVILSDNQLTGELPASLINNNQGLRQLRLSGNKISKLPQDPIRSSRLTFLDLQNNALEASIPEGIRGLSALQTLDLRGNTLDGGVPDSLFQITTLRNLYLADNSLFGRISTSFGALTDIRRVELTGNNFIGSIPEELCALKSDPGSLEFLTADCEDVFCTCCDNDCAP